MVKVRQLINDGILIQGVHSPPLNPYTLALVLVPLGVLTLGGRENCKLSLSFLFPEYEEKLSKRGDSCELEWRVVPLDSEPHWIVTNSMKGEFFLHEFIR